MHLSRLLGSGSTLLLLLGLRAPVTSFSLTRHTRMPITAKVCHVPSTTFTVWFHLTTPTSPFMGFPGASVGKDGDGLVVWSPSCLFATL